MEVLSSKSFENDHSYESMFSEAMFYEALAYIVRNVSAWGKLSPEEKKHHKNRIHAECIIDINEGQEPAQAFADAVFKLLKAIGCSGAEAANIWVDTIQHSFEAVNKSKEDENANKPRLKAI